MYWDDCLILNDDKKENENNKFKLKNKLKNNKKYELNCLKRTSHQQYQSNDNNNENNGLCLDNQTGSFVCVVRDTGHGISTENLKDVFKEGMQFNANQLQGGSGSGLGLWISKNIVELHGGSLSVHSDGEEKGCVFTVRLPAYHSETLEIIEKTKELTKLTYIEPTSPLNATSTTRQDISEIDILKQLLIQENIHQILVVDDAPTSRKMVCRLLRIVGCELREAVNGQECLDMLNDVDIFPKPPDLILMDYEMPV